MAKTKTKSPTSPVSVDIVSDIVCPWCWLGKKYFDEAVRKSGRQVEVNWRPYMLDPNVAENGVPYSDYMKAKFGDGPSDKFKAMREHLEAAAPDAGIEFKFNDIPMRPNTLDAHRLVRWASGQGKGGEAKEALFQAFFKDLRDVGDWGVLIDIGHSLGLDPDITQTLLIEGRDRDEVMEEINFFRQLGVSGVPTFIYNGQFAVSGAQPVSKQLEAIKHAASLPAPEDV